MWHVQKTQVETDMENTLNESCTAQVLSMSLCTNAFITCSKHGGLKYIVNYKFEN